MKTVLRCLSAENLEQSILEPLQPTGRSVRWPHKFRIFAPIPELYDVRRAPKALELAIALPFFSVVDSTDHHLGLDA